MRNVILSFDDGLYDFKTNALPLFDKYGFKASINVITKYSEDGYFDEYRYLSIEDLKELKKHGFELACHTNSHQRNIEIEDLKVSLDKMRKYFGSDKYGCILPYSQPVDSDKKDFINSHFLYLADHTFKRRKNNIYYYLCFLIGKIFKIKKALFYYCNYSYFYNKQSGFYCFKRLPIKNNFTYKTYIRFLKHMPNNTSITLMFHSIIKAGEACPWPDGSWECDNLDMLLRFLSKHKKQFNVVTQRSLTNG